MKQFKEQILQSILIYYKFIPWLLIFYFTFFYIFNFNLKIQSNKIKNNKSNEFKQPLNPGLLLSQQKLFELNFLTMPRECTSFYNWISCSINHSFKTKLNTLEKILSLKKLSRKYFPWANFSSVTIFRNYLSNKYKNTFATIKKINFPRIKISSPFERKKVHSNQEIRGIYISLYQMRANILPTLLTKIKKNLINGIVFDIKNVKGELSIIVNSPGLKNIYRHQSSPSFRLENFLTLLNKNNIHTIGRISIFKDAFLATNKPLWAAKGVNGRRSGKWLNPMLKVVQDHHIQLAKEAAIKGVREIQLDYIRFPYPGELHQGNILYYRKKNRSKAARHKVITNFLERLKKELGEIPVLLSADVFGIVAWEAEKDILAIGQKLIDMADHLDILSPMLYPSHFSKGFSEFSNPADHPQYFLYHGTRRIIERTSKKIPIRPWIQAFPMRVTNYNEDYILTQIKALKKAGGIGYLLWNSANHYDSFWKISPDKLK